MAASQARPCEACGRPNGAAAPRCLYCGHALAAVATAPEVRPASSSVAILPGQAGPAAEQALARLLGKDAYHAQQVLRSPDARTYSFDDRAAADDLARRLRAAAIRCVRYEAADVDAVTPPLYPVAVAVGAPGDRALALWLDGTAPRTVPVPPDAFAVVGRVTRVVVTSTPSQRSGVLAQAVGGLAGSVLDALRPEVMDRRKESDTRMVLDLFTGGRRFCFVEDHTRVDAPGVPVAARAGVVAHRALLTWFERLAPAIAFDRGFEHHVKRAAATATSRPGAARPEGDSAVHDDAAAWTTYAARAFVIQRAPG